MKLYYAPGACSLASHIALVESGADYELAKVDLKQHRLEDGGDFHAVSPRGYVPAIETDDLGLLTENPAVLSYLQERYVGVPDKAQHYRQLEWLGFIGTEIHGGYHPLFGGDSEDRQAKAKETLARKYRLTAELMDGRQWLVGDTPTVADNYLFVTLLWAEKFGVELPRALADFRTRNLARPAVQEAMTCEGLG